VRFIEVTIGNVLTEGVFLTFLCAWSRGINKKLTTLFTVSRYGPVVFVFGGTDSDLWRQEVLDLRGDDGSGLWKITIDVTVFRWSWYVESCSNISNLILLYNLSIRIYFRCYAVHVVELLNYYTNYCTYIKFIKIYICAVVGIIIESV